MGCEIGTINGGFESKKQVECFIECFNAIMRDKEPWFDEDEHTISRDDFDDDFSCELDIWGRFENTMNTPLKNVVGELIKRHPSEGFYLDYSREWDNCGEVYYEEYGYKDGRLVVQFKEEDVRSKEDYDEEDDDMDECEETDFDEDDYGGNFVHEVIREEEYVFEHTDSGLKLISGKPNKALAEAMGIEL